MTTTLTLTSGQSSFTSQGYTIVPNPGTAVPDGLVQAILSAASVAGVVLSSSAGTGTVIVNARSFYSSGSGAPTSGSWQLGDEVEDGLGAVYRCTAAGSPGTWIQTGAGTYAPLAARAPIELTMQRTQEAALANTVSGASVGAWSAASAATSITSGVDVLSIVSGAPNPLFRGLRANIAQRGATYPNSTVTKGIGLSWPAAQITNGDGPTELTPMFVFRHKGAAVFEVIVYGRGTTSNRIRVRVDGKWISSTPLDGPSNDGQLHRLPITLPDTASHEIALEFSGFNCWFYGVARGPSATVTAVTRSFGPRLIIAGDSQVEGQDGTTINSNPFGFAREIGRLLGLDDTVQSGMGSTGWVSDSSGTRYKMRDRLTADVINLLPDGVPSWVHFQHGQNDAAFTYSAIQTEVLYCIDQIRAAKPLAFITGQSQFRPSTGAGLTAVRAALIDAYGARNVPFLDMTSWLTGTGKVGSEVGDGNNDYYTSSDGSHLSTPYGHPTAGRRIAAWMQQYLPQVGVTFPHIA